MGGANSGSVAGTCSSDSNVNDIAVGYTCADCPVTGLRGLLSDYGCICVFPYNAVHLTPVRSTCFDFCDGDNL